MEGFDIEAARCGKCLQGYYQTGGACKDCENDVVWITGLKIAGTMLTKLVIVTYMYYRFNRPNPAGMITLSSLVTFLQALQTLSRLPLRWPSALLLMFRVLNWFTIPGFLNLTLIV